MLSVFDQNLVCRRGPLTDGGGTYNGSSQQVFAQNLSRRYLLVQNQGAAVAYVNIGSAAAANQTSIKLNVAGTVGDTAIWDAGFIPTGVVNVIGTNTQLFAAKEG